MGYRNRAQRLFPPHSQRGGGWRPVTARGGKRSDGPQTSPRKSRPHLSSATRAPPLVRDRAGLDAPVAALQTPPLCLDVSCAEGARAPGSVAQWIAHWTSRQTEAFKGCGFESHQSRFSFDK